MEVVVGISNINTTIKNIIVRLDIDLYYYITPKGNKMFIGTKKQVEENALQFKITEHRQRFAYLLIKKPNLSKPEKLELNRIYAYHKRLIKANANHIWNPSKVYQKNNFTYTQNDIYTLHEYYSDPDNYNIVDRLKHFPPTKNDNIDESQPLVKIDVIEEFRQSENQINVIEELKQSENQINVIEKINQSENQINVIEELKRAENQINVIEKINQSESQIEGLKRAENKINVIEKIKQSESQIEGLKQAENKINVIEKISQSESQIEWLKQDVNQINVIEKNNQSESQIEGLKQAENKIKVIEKNIQSENQIEFINQFEKQDEISKPISRLIEKQIDVIEKLKKSKNQGENIKQSKNQVEFNSQVKKQEAISKPIISMIEKEIDVNVSNSKQNDINTSVYNQDELVKNRYKKHMYTSANGEQNYIMIYCSESDEEEKEEVNEPDMTPERMAKIEECNKILSEMMNTKLPPNKIDYMLGDQSESELVDDDELVYEDVSAPDESKKSEYGFDE